jgi:hypothetical protein
MKSSIKILATLLVFAALFAFVFSKFNNGVVKTAVSSPTPTASSSMEWSTYSNFGILFKYPKAWGIPTETLSNNGLGSLAFNRGSTMAQPLDFYIAQDIALDGSGVIHETFDQMIARFRKNDEYIYDVKNITADGVEGRELFFKSAVTLEPYHVEAIFPFRDTYFVTLGGDFELVPLETFESIVASLNLHATSPSNSVSTSGTILYNNNGVEFQYPAKLAAKYALLRVNVSFDKEDQTKKDSNGCYSPEAGENGKSVTGAVKYINGIKFCVGQASDAGMGSLYTIYNYTTFRNGIAYNINYQADTSSCAGYQNSPDLSSPENKTYNECMAERGNSKTLVQKPIEDSIATFKFVN